MQKKRKLGNRVRMTAAHAAYYGQITELTVKNAHATFEQIFKKVFPKGMPHHKNPAALKEKYLRAYRLART